MRNPVDKLIDTAQLAVIKSLQRGEPRRTGLTTRVLGYYPGEAEKEDQLFVLLEARGAFPGVILETTIVNQVDRILFLLDGKQGMDRRLGRLRRRLIRTSRR